MLRPFDVEDVPAFQDVEGFGRIVMGVQRWPNPAGSAASSSLKPPYESSALTVITMLTEGPQVVWSAFTCRHYTAAIRHQFLPC